MKHLLFIVTGLVITVLALVYALWGIDFGSLASVFLQADYRVLVPFLGCLVLFFVFNAMRWVLILRPLGRYTLRQSVPAMMIGFAGNNVFPARLGELIRSVVFARQHGLPASGVLVTVGVERVLDVFAILLFYFSTVMFMDPLPREIRLGADWVAVVLGGICVVILLFLHWPQVFLSLWDRLSRRLPGAVQHKGHALLQNTTRGLMSLKSWASLAWLILHSVLRWTAGGAMVWLSLKGFGVAVSFQAAIIVLAVTALAVTVPSSPGFLGPIQAAFVFALPLFGISREVALAASVFFLVAQWIPVTLIGALFFFSTGLRLREVQEAAEHIQT